MQALKAKADELLTSIPFRSTHELAQPLYEALLKRADNGTQTAPEDSSNSPDTLALDEPGASFPGLNRSATLDDPPAPAPEKTNQEGGGSDVNVGIVVGPIAAVLVLVLLGVLTAVFVRRHRAKQRKRKAMAGKGQDEVRPEAV